jgi:type IV pilus assembly protein PilO
MAKLKLKINFKDPKVQQVLIAVVIIAGSAYAWYDQFYTPISASIAELSSQKEKLEAELLRINALKPQLERLRQEAIALEAKLDSLKNIFPDSKEVPRLIRDLTAANRRSNVVTTRFTPKPDVVQEYYIENKYDVSVAGNYHNLGALFSHLANFQLIVNLTNVAITANPAYASGGGGSGSGNNALAAEAPPSVLATFELTTFSSRR